MILMDPLGTRTEEMMILRGTKLRLTNEIPMLGKAIYPENNLLTIITPKITPPMMVNKLDLILRRVLERPLGPKAMFCLSAL